jgi:hypothetical protein
MWKFIVNAYVISGVVGGVVGFGLSVLLTEFIYVFSPVWFFLVSILASGFIGGGIGWAASPTNWAYTKSATRIVLVAVGASIIGAMVGLMAAFFSLFILS